MATLVLSAVGGAIGGPIGVAIGSIIGRQVDNAVFGGGSREGPRLKDLAVTTSTYGQSMPRHFGRMRTAGTVIWSTELIETSSKEGGGKGRPSVRTYSYSISFAVALSSTPIARLGRIWADGNLLRGADEDLKVDGTLRTYLGTGDSPVDPVIAADQGEHAPAFRDCAYVVFENLQLADYGNRIPALTFEIFSEQDQGVSLRHIVPQSQSRTGGHTLAQTKGFADEGGPVLGSLLALNQVIPLRCVTTADGLLLEAGDEPANTPILLPEQLSRAANGRSEERNKQRAEQVDQVPTALRYYDEDRDYQPSVQRSIGSRPNGRENMVDLPATMNAEGARLLANTNAQRARWLHERISWRVAELDPAIRPGSLVRIPDISGNWSVKSWEWFDQGIELGLERAAPATTGTLATDAGSLIPPTDLPASATELLFTELPPDGSTNADAPLLFAASSSATEAWRGASLYAEQGNTLLPIGSTDPRRGVIGVLAHDLDSSPALLIEPRASMTVELIADDLEIPSTDVEGIAAGANRLMVGAEVLQFLTAEPLSDRVWRLSGLLRGRAGTEDAAAEMHPAGRDILFIDDRLTQLDPAQVSARENNRIAAIGRGDEAPVFAPLANAGLSRRPLTPVHPQLVIDSDLSWRFCWTRRARGQWRWEDGVEVPLIEEQERYVIGFGPVTEPFEMWVETTPEFLLSQAERAALVSQYQAGSLWVEQVGTFARSTPLFLASLS